MVREGGREEGAAQREDARVQEEEGGPVVDGREGRGAVAEGEGAAEGDVLRCVAVVEAVRGHAGCVPGVEALLDVLGCCEEVLELVLAEGRWGRLEVGVGAGEEGREVREGCEELVEGGPWVGYPGGGGPVW